MECHEWVGKTGSPATPVSASTTPAAPISTDVESLAVSTPSSGVRDGQSPPADDVRIEEVSDQPKDMDVDMPSTSEEASTKEATETSVKTEATELTPAPDTPEVLFRCFRCTYTAHDKCLRPHPSLDKDTDQALVIKQYRKDWKCHQCLEWDRELDQILAFRDVPIAKANAEPSGEMEIDSTDAKTSEPAMVDSKDGTPPQAPNTVREFLIKWKGMSYRKVTWVPSYWVSQVVSPAKVKSFWKKTFEPAEAKDVILDEWTQVDVVMDVVFDQDFDGNEDDMDALDYIQSVFVKWKGLDYEHCKLSHEQEVQKNVKWRHHVIWRLICYGTVHTIATWDDPDEPDSPHYASFKQAYKDWVAAQKIHIPNRAKKGRSGPQPRPLVQHPFAELKEQPSYVSGGTLKDYQMDGLK